ncbi:mechanosensitive ion channel family protein [Ancylobacter dichloromethanicus]
MFDLTIVGALIAGYVTFATFLASRSLIAVVMAGALYLVVALINSVFIDALATGPRARHVAKTLGVRPASLELLAVLAAGLLKVVAIIGIVVLVVGTFGTSTSDLADLASRVTLGFTIGSSTISIGDILSALLFLVVGIVIARAIQRWFAVAILPKTAFDQGLQNSIATIIGYIGSITVIAMAMSQLGLNLENIALVAGALSVGIGFGLQSIVSNFVSGLILLAERPIRVGDTIAVKGEEGYVRRISVRATEIETFDRAAVLIPNSDLITGMVKNFTHANTTGRVIVAVNVSYDADADEVRDLLIGCACDHPQVLRSPPPRVFLMAFGDSYLKFELRCVVANVDYALTVKSDLHFAVLDRLKAARIGIPYTPWSIYRGGRIGEDPPAGDGDS